MRDVSVQRGRRDCSCGHFEAGPLRATRNTDGGEHRARVLLVVPRPMSVGVWRSACVLAIPSDRETQLFANFTVDSVSDLTRHLTVGLAELLRGTSSQRH
jgi:hypothetical protein